MTLISMVNGMAYPVIISDRAISDQTQKQQVVLPTTNRMTIRETPVVAFRVKTLIIQDILCVAFAGAVSTIDRLYTEIYDFFRYRPVSQQTVSELMQELAYGDEVALMFALGGAEFPGNRLQVAYSGNWLRNNDQEELDILSTGSGAMAWNEHFVKHARYLEKTGLNSLDSKQRALLSCVAFQAHEHKATHFLQDGWGGGFDLVYYEDSRFHRYDELSYAFFFADAENPDQLQPYAFIHNSYYHGNAIVRNIAREQQMIHIIKQFCVLDTFPEKLFTLDCNSNEVATCVFIFKNGEHYSDLAVLIYDLEPNGGPMFFTKTQGEQWGIQFRPVYYEKVKEAVRLFLS